MMTSVAIFCGSSSGSLPIYEKVTREVAKLLSEKKITIVYGGGSVGLMGKLTDATIEHNGKIIGVIPERLVQLELAHPEATEMITVDSMHERKAKMAQISEAFIALPGGMGTIEEITEMFTLTQLGYFQKPCILLNTNGFYNHFIAFMDTMVANKFLKQEHRNMMLVVDTPQELITALGNKKFEYIQKWQ